MLQELTDLLKALSALPGVSGYEDAVREFLRERYADYVDEFSTDPLGNLMMLKRGERPADTPGRTIMLAAHTDEIGAMVTDIEAGFLRVTNVGGLDVRMLLGQEVTVFGREPLHGVVASVPPHFGGQRNKYPAIGDFQIDLGLPPETVAQKVRVGDIVTIHREAVALLGDNVSGKAMDDRASVAALYVCLQELSKLRHQWDVYAVATSQEEVGLRGAFTSAHRLAPDAAIAIDVTFANAGSLSSGQPTDLGKGPGLVRGANIHPVMFSRLQKTAETLEMSLQIEPYPGNTGTDAWAIQTSLDGIPTALLDVPLRYMHAPVETVNVKDIWRIGRLMAHFIAGLTDDFIDELTPKDGFETPEEDNDAA